MPFKLPTPSGGRGPAMLVPRLLLTAALAIGSGIRPALAQYIVFDPTNYAQTAVSAAQNVMSVSKQASQYLLQLQQYQSQLAQLKTLPGIISSSSIGTVATQIAQLQAYVSGLKKLSGSIDGVKAGFDLRMREAAASNLSFEQYLNQSIAAARARGQSASALYKAELDSMATLGEVYASTKALQDQIPQTEGMHQAMQLMNAQMNQMLAQTADLQQRGMLAHQAALAREATEASTREAVTQHFYNLTSAQQQLNRRALEDVAGAGRQAIFR